MPTTGLPSWESVLAEVEQDVLRTEALLVLAVADPADPVEARVAALATQLSSPDADVPPLDRMPAVPAGLVDRVQALRARIAEARAALEAAMTTTRRQLAEVSAVPAPHVAGARARFVDTVA